MSVNIPRDIEDPFYRYKMPVMDCVHQGRGNGVKTIIVNLVEIADALERDVVYIMKFFGFHLGTNASLKNKKYTINGKHDRHDLEDALDVFIDKYVICGMCGNPETVIRRSKLNCKACGAKNPLVEDKLITFIRKRQLTNRK